MSTSPKLEREAVVLMRCTRFWMNEVVLVIYRLLCLPRRLLASSYRTRETRTMNKELPKGGMTQPPRK